MIYMVKHDPLTVTHPELCKEWSERNFPFLPEDETAWSVSKVWWKGTCGHEWQARIQNRAGNQTGCPYCAGKIIIKGFNDFATKHPELVPEWSERNGSFKPDQVTEFSDRRAWWKCAYGHEWQTAVSNRSHGNGCPICRNQPVIPGVNDLATVLPQIAAEWSERNGELKPSQITPAYRKQVWWRCPACHEEYLARPATRARKADRKCPYCIGRFKHPHPAPGVEAEVIKADE